jgi:hypothetical protein
VSVEDKRAAIKVFIVEFFKQAGAYYLNIQSKTPPEMVKYLLISFTGECWNWQTGKP